MVNTDSRPPTSHEKNNGYHNTNMLNDEDDKNESFSDYPS